MRSRLARALILLALTLAVRNAQCFAQCLTQSGGSSATHCQQHGQAKSSHCVMQHDVNVESASVAAPADGFPIALAETHAVAIDSASRHAAPCFAASPPALLSDALTIPLRV